MRDKDVPHFFVPFLELVGWAFSVILNDEFLDVPKLVIFPVSVIRQNQVFSTAHLPGATSARGRFFKFLGVLGVFAVQILGYNLNNTCEEHYLKFKLKKFCSKLYNCFVGVKKHQWG